MINNNNIIKKADIKADIAVLVGQTAVGKTDISIKIASTINAEIISADSVQIYKKMNIGSAKPSASEMQGIKHHMIDIIEPSVDVFTVSEYQKMAFECIEDIKSRGKKVLVVGGTGLYIQSLCDYMDFAGVGQDLEFRQEWNEKERAEKGVAHRELEKIDSQAAQRIHENDVKRTIRALEIAQITNKSKLEHNKNDENLMPKYTSVQAGLTMNRAKLYDKINQRVDQMINDGLIKEVENLLNSGVSRNAKSMQALGYKEIEEYLDDRCDLEDAIETLKQSTRRFAKRQNTWFKRDDRIRWFDLDEEEFVNNDEICAKISEYYLDNLA